MIMGNFQQIHPVSYGDGNSSVVRERRTRDQKVASSIPARAAEEFSSSGSIFCADSYFGIRSTPVLPQWT